MNKEKFIKFAMIVKDRFTGAEITNTSVLIAYYVLLSLCPMIIVLGSILPYLRIDPTVVVEYAQILLPAPVQPVLEPIIQNLLTSASGSMLTISSLVLLWSASKGINYLQLGINRAYGVRPESTYLLKRLTSLFTLLVIFLLLVAFIVVFGFGETVLNYLSPLFDWAEPLSGFLRDVKWPVTLIFLFCMFAVVYFITPDTVVRLRHCLPGAALTTVGLLLLVQAFALYVRFATRTFSSYGTLSAFFVLMFWLNFSAMLVIAGGVLNASIYEYKFGRAEEEKSELVVSLRNRLLDRLIQRWKARRAEKKAARQETPAEPDTKDTK